MVSKSFPSKSSRIMFIYSLFCIPEFWYPNWVRAHQPLWEWEWFGEQEQWNSWTRRWEH